MLFELGHVLADQLETAGEFDATPKVEFGKWPCRGLWTIWQHEIVAHPVGLVAIEEETSQRDTEGYDQKQKAYPFVVGVLFWDINRRTMTEQADGYLDEIEEALGEIQPSQLTQNDQHFRLSLQRIGVYFEGAAQSFWCAAGMRVYLERIAEWEVYKGMCKHDEYTD
ncbi:MAG: hypothetical protein AAF639_33080 [Chloroflexota bacterium]